MKLKTKETLFSPCVAGAIIGLCCFMGRCVAAMKDFVVTDTEIMPLAILGMITGVLTCVSGILKTDIEKATPDDVNS